MARRKLLLGNWKMNHTIAESKEFCSHSADMIKLAAEKGIDIGVAPSYLSLQTVKENAGNMIVAAQDCHFADHGAYTGFVSIPMIKELGIDWCLVGHSERRLYAAETSLTCNRKIKALIENKMIVVYCVGESLADFESGRTKSIVKEQLLIGLMDIAKEDTDKIVVAYEPVWSIGTGKNASVEIAEDICGYIRKLLADMFGQEKADTIRVLYGGSVKPVNVNEYMKAPDIDGALVGGASLAPDSFAELIKNI
ncbi:MAG TPA: triose-phosphate isomerase [Firmicutes bacterium]|nr:triose-phosphate isomerase [Bacillota bacterium]